MSNDGFLGQSPEFWEHMRQVGQRIGQRASKIVSPTDLAANAEVAELRIEIARLKAEQAALINQRDADMDAFLIPHAGSRPAS